MEKRKRNERKVYICPKCGKKTNEYPALSRMDGKTDICPACGQDEAIEALRRAKGTTWEERAQFYIEHQDTIGLMSDHLLWSSEEFVIWFAKTNLDARKMIIENCKNPELLKKLKEL
jgi:predicted RNA-binding Zn-ribbon protein involved in translation (DUF1610 family)